MNNKSGVVTVENWTMAPNGETYLHFWAEKWVVETDKGFAAAMGLKDFRSSERWQLIGVRDGEPALILPGCQVKGFYVCDLAPPNRNCFRV